MERRMTVQYSISESEMASEIKRLLNRSLLKISELDKAIKDDLSKNDGYVDDDNIYKLLLFINSIRDSLADIDFGLNECSSIAYGYHDYLIKKQIPSTDAKPSMEELISQMTSDNGALNAERDKNE
tara:strand:+ start:32359 stop:32736 length:378 start_codon:yes stop_codon:yes gene_type:complete